MTSHKKKKKQIQKNYKLDEFVSETMGNMNIHQSTVVDWH